METSSRRYKISLSTADDAPETAPILLLGDICANLKRASKFGYDAIEIHLRENEEIDVDAIIDTCKKYSMRISALVTGRLAVQENVSMVDACPDKQKRALDGIKRYIDLAEKLNTNIIIGWIRGKVLNNDVAGFEKQLAVHMRDIASYAQPKNVRVLIEAINRYEINSFNTAQQTVDFIERNHLENVFVHADTFHMNIEEEDLTKAIIQSGKYLGYVHMADSNRRYPGAGHIDFLSVIRALDQVQYNGYISLECLPLPTGKDAAEKAIQYIEPMIKS